MRREKLNLILSVIAWALAVACVLAYKFVWVPEHTSEPDPPKEVVVVQHLKPEPVPEPEQKYYDVPLDHDTQDLVRSACEESGIDMELALAVIWKETDFRNISGDGGNSYGYMQIQPRWHSDRMDRLGVTDLMDPESNFRVGCDFLAELQEKYALAYALTCYNSGKATVSEYSEDVMSRMEVLRNGNL